MNEGIKITRQQANKIIIDWQKSGKSHKELTICGPMGWFDVSHLTPEELHAFKHKLVKQLTGKEWNHREATIDL